MFDFEVIQINACSDFLAIPPTQSNGLLRAKKSILVNSVYII